MTTAENLKEAFVLLEANGIDMVFLDLGLGMEDGLEAVARIKSRFPNVDVVVVSGQKEPKRIVEAIRSGAADYLLKPFEIEELVAVIEKSRPLRVMRERHLALMEGINRAAQSQPMIGESPSFQEVLQKAIQVKGHRVPVLIEGESGTGKELLARWIHQQEDPKRPFVAVNCAAIPESLLESELFGHEKGSFTGAYTKKIGKFELASGGDIFLDEISCLKWDLQAKILRALQEKEISRIGGNDPIHVDFRVIAATNENLERLVEEKRFRRDLYHRLRVIALKVPPLRARQGDIPLMIEYFLKKHDRQGGHRFSTAAMQALLDYPWPGNVREIGNLIQSLAILVPEKEITREDLPDWLFRRDGFSAFSAGDLANTLVSGQVIPLRDYIGRIEKAYIEKALEVTRGDKTKAASLLNISRTRLYERLKVWGMIGE